MPSLFHRSRAVLAALALSSILYTGCDTTDPGEDPGEEELITTVTLVLTDASNPATVVRASATDPDGDGSDLQIETLGLRAGATYDGRIELLNETANPDEDIADEVRAEAEAHQFFYVPSGGIAGRVAVTVTDLESDYGRNQVGTDLPVGLEFRVVVSPGAAATGTLNVVLSHYEDPSLKNGTRRGESDVDLEFPVAVGG